MCVKLFTKTVYYNLWFVSRFIIVTKKKKISHFSFFWLSKRSILKGRNKPNKVLITNKHKRRGPKHSHFSFCLNSQHLFFFLPFSWSCVSHHLFTLERNRVLDLHVPWCGLRLNMLLGAPNPTTGSRLGPKAPYIQLG